MRNAIGVKFGAALFAATLTPILYFGYHDFTAERERLADEKLRELYVNCVSRAKSMEWAVINAHADLNSLRTAMPLRFLLDIPEGKPDAIPYWRSLVEQEFHRFLSLKTDYAQVGLIDADGDETLILSRNGTSLVSRPREELRNRLTAPHFTAVASLERYGIAAIPMRDAADPRRPLGEVTLLRYAAQVYDRLGRPRYVLYIDLNGAHTEYSLTHTTFETRRPAALLTGAGRYLYDPFAEERAPQRSGGGPTDIRDEYPSEVTRQILSGRSGVIADDPAALYAYAPLHPQVGDPSFYYVLFDRYPRSELEPALAPLRRRYQVGAAVALGLALALAAGVSGALTRHLRKLRNGVERIAARDLTHRIDIRSGDEIERLAAAYNDMAASLKEYHEGLERKVAERTEQIRAVEKRLTHAQKLASIGFLAAGVAHEVNNPVAIILTRIDLLRNALGRDAGTTVVKDLEVIRHHAARIGQIAGGLLTFSRSAPGPVGPVDVNRIAARVCGLIAHPLAKKGIVLATQFTEGPLMARGSETGLEQTLYNLLYNAYQATGEGGTIRVVTGVDVSEVVISVADDGIGIAPEHLDRVFDPFFTTKEPGEGTGLGLSISYGLVKEYDGALSVRSEPGAGAEFTIRLPAMAAGVSAPGAQEASAHV
ncbi:MAG: sensor histidine kinase [Nitrospinae bacterium]|nr:sensor histidine kinase [Nitrospinota bacterium]